MDIRPRTQTTRTTTRGSGPDARPRRSDARGPRKDVIIRLPEEVAQQLKMAALYEHMTVQDFCVQALLPSLDKALKKHGLPPLQS